MAVAEPVRGRMRHIIYWPVAFWIWLTAKKSERKEDKDGLRTMYFGQALHYYIAARYATTAKFAPIPGNLVHHAIEFFLKGALIEKLDNRMAE